MSRPRREVEEFANYMEDVLRDNDDKGGWQSMSILDIIDRMEEELHEVRTVYLKSKSTDWRALKHEAADVANFCMMLADVIDKRYLFPDTQGKVTE